MYETYYDLLCKYILYILCDDSDPWFQNWELLVLSKLQWNIASITGYDFVDQILERCTWGNDTQLIRRHAHTLVSICYTGKYKIEIAYL